MFYYLFAILAIRLLVFYDGAFNGSIKVLKRTGVDSSSKDPIVVSAMGQGRVVFIVNYWRSGVLVYGVHTFKDQDLVVQCPKKTSNFADTMQPCAALGYDASRLHYAWSQRLTLGAFCDYPKITFQDMRLGSDLCNYFRFTSSRVWRLSHLHYKICLSCCRSHA